MNIANTSVLIADDQPDVRSALRLLLEQQSAIKVTGEASDAVGLLIWLAGNTADVLLLDWQLPGKNGADLIPQLHSIYPKMLIIALDSLPDTKREAIAAGACDFVSKNEPPERLLEVVEHCRPQPKRDRPHESITGGSGGDEYYFSDFKNIRVNGAFKLEIFRGDSYNITVLSDDPYHIMIEKEDNNTLRIGRRGFDWMFALHRQAEIKITMPELNYLVLSGASTGKIHGFQSAHDLELELNGASRLEMRDITTGSVRIKSHGASVLTGFMKADGETKIDVLGAGRVELEGTTKDVTINAMGASRVEVDRLQALNAHVKLMGASRCAVNVNGRLDASLAGASNLTWTGNPTMGDIETIGASSIRRK